METNMPSDEQIARLTRRRHELLTELSLLEEELNKKRAENRCVTTSEDIQWSERSSFGLNFKGKSRRAHLIAPELGLNVHNFHLFIAELPPGSEEGAYHMHGEAAKYYLKGRGIEIIGDTKYEVKAGDTVFIPADTWHGTQNPGPDTLCFLAVTTAGVGVPLVKQTLYKIRKDMVLEYDDK